MKKSLIFLSIILLALLSFLVYNKLVDNESSFEQGNNNNSDFNDGYSDNVKNDDSDSPDIIDDDTFEKFDRLYRIDQQGEVVVGVTYLNPVENDDDYLNFEIIMDTHSVDLDVYDLSHMTVLTIGNKLVAEDNVNWKVLSGGGHHVVGIIQVSKEQVDFKNITFIEMEIKNLDNIESRKFRWDGDDI